jgi:CRP/FNR family transcriptional regulator, cyclic AMP receptor protein
MPLIPNKAAFQNSLASLPLVTYQAGETVIANGSRTGRLLILKKGAVAIVKEDTEIAQVAEPGAVFGELSVLLDQPHTADVRALETSQFHIADATAFLTENPIAVLYVATMLAHRLDGANQALIQIKHQLSAGEPHSVVAKTVNKMERLLAVGRAKAQVANSGEYKFQVADQDYADYKQNPTSLRLAYHLAVSLFHLRDWTFAEHSSAANWPYATTIGNYQRDLENLCGDFGYMRDLANAVKHKELDVSKKPSTQMVGLANTEVSMAAFQPGAFQGNAFQTRTVIVSETAPAKHVDFEKAADAVMSMWNKLFATHGWL